MVLTTDQAMVWSKLTMIKLWWKFYHKELAREIEGENYPWENTKKHKIFAVPTKEVTRIGKNGKETTKLIS